jgi:hypothetical protein
MIAYNCPLGKQVCDGCNYLNTRGYCVLAYQPVAVSISQEEIADLWERRKEALMKLSKEDLVELIIGRKQI